MRRKDSIAGLRRQIIGLECAKCESPAPLAFGVTVIDRVLNGGLAAGRMHEVNGISSWGLAIMLAGRTDGPVLWCTRNTLDHRLYPPGCVAFGLQPHHLLMVICRNQTDALWACEEGLRSGAMGMVVLETTGVIDLTAARRLQLAAEAGGGFGLVVGMGHASVFPAAASRWQASPAQGAGLCMFLELTRNQAGSGGQWMVEWNETARHLSVVPSSCRRSGDASVALPA